jgi:hypothetical protein
MTGRGVGVGDDRASFEGALEVAPTEGPLEDLLPAVGSRLGVVHPLAGCTDVLPTEAEDERGYPELRRGALQLRLMGRDLEVSGEIEKDVLCPS